MSYIVKHRHKHLRGTRRRLQAMCLLAAISATVVYANTATAAPTAAERKTAIKLAGEALDLFEAGDYEKALDNFRQADALLNAPTLKLRIARSLDRLNRVAEAIEVYREIIALELPKTASPKHHEARKDAVTELAELIPQQPSISISIEGPGARDAGLTVDGETWADRDLGDTHKLDPGRHVAELLVPATSTEDERRVRKVVTLDRGEQRELVLSLPAIVGAEQRADASMPGGQVAGWALLGVGGAAVVAGAILGGVSVAERGDLEGRCPNDVCPPEAHDDAEALDRLRFGSTGTLIAGGVLAAVGVTLLLISDDEPSDDKSATSVTVRPFPLVGWGLTPATNSPSSLTTPSAAMTLGLGLKGSF